jgi:hypothetical protein
MFFYKKYYRVTRESQPQKIATSKNRTKCSVFNETDDRHTKVLRHIKSRLKRKSAQTRAIFMINLRY